MKLLTNITGNQKRSILSFLFISTLAYFSILGFAITSDETNSIKLSTNCILVGDYYECNATANSIENSTFVVVTGENVECPYECCVSETGYIEKVCDSRYNCEDNQCIKIGTTISITQPMNFTTLITIIGGIVVAVLIIIYLILKKKQKPVKTIAELKAKYRKRK